jgi:hypothetical protein
MKNDYAIHKMDDNGNRNILVYIYIYIHIYNALSNWGMFEDILQSKILLGKPQNLRNIIRHVCVPETKITRAGTHPNRL